MNLKLKPFVLKNLLRLTLIQLLALFVLLFSNVSLAQEKCQTLIEKPNFLDRAHNTFFKVSTLISEPILQIDPRRYRAEDRRIAHQMLAQYVRRNSGEKFDLENVLKSIDEGLLTAVTLYEWNTKTLSVGKLGAVASFKKKTISQEELKTHFSQSMPQEMADIAKETVDALANKKMLDSWLKSAKIEILKEMWNDGVPLVHFRIGPIREFYLDKVLAKRAAAAGLVVQENGLPFDVVTFNDISFYNHLAKGHLFVDWTGIKLRGQGAEHFARGHLIALTYFAETVPGFYRLYRHIGETKDKAGFWQYMADNTDSTATPYWHGHWIMAFGSYLGARY